MEADINWVGRQIGYSYSILSLIAVGGMSQVYLARDNQRDCFVVVKIATNSSKYANLVKSLKREASILQRLSHPNVVRLIDFGDIEDSYFLVLEYVDGHTVSSLFRSRVLSLEFCIVVMRQLLQALHYVNQVGFAHCDVKPDNVIFARNGVIKLVDFGIARPINAVGGSMNFLLGNGGLAGTLPFVSPEQILYSDLDCRSDLYSCGILFYEILTGRSPFEVSKFMHDDGSLVDYWNMPIRPFPDVPNVPEGIRALIKKAMQVDPNNRHQSALEMEAELLSVLGAESVEELLLGSVETVLGAVTQPLNILP